MTDETQGQCRYFLSYTGVKLPLKLVTELEVSQLENRNTYFRGYFDDGERLVGLQKLVYGEVEMEHRYTYDANGVLRRVKIMDADGEWNEMEIPAEGGAE